MIKKSLLFGLLAALAAVFIFIGCDSGGDTEYVYVSQPYAVHVDTVVSDQSGLEDALEDSYYNGKIIGFDGSGITLATDDVTIPAGYTVYLLNGSDLATSAASDLIVAGTVYVGYGATLDASTAGAIEVSTGGIVSVVKNGTLSIADIDSIYDGDETTVLGTNQVVITNGELVIDTITDTATGAAADLAPAFASVRSGYITVTTALTVVKSSEIAAISGPSATKSLSITANTAEGSTPTSLTIPVGLNLTTNAALADVTALTVYGDLTASSATLKSAGAKIVVGAGGSASLGTVAVVLADSSVGAGGYLGGTFTDLDSEATLAVGAYARVNGIRFPGATIISSFTGGLTIGNLTIPVAVAGDDDDADVLYIPASTTLTVTGTLTVDGTLAFAGDTSKLIIQQGGTLAAAATGKFVAKYGTTDDGSAVDLGVTENTDTTTLTGFSSTDAVPVVLTSATASGNDGTDYIIGNAKFAKLKGAETAKTAAAITSTAAGSGNNLAGSIKAATGAAIVLKGEA
jgi:hypothetical protein